LADNVAITAGSGTTVASDDVGSGVQQQRVKITWGVDGTGNDVNATTPLPVELVPKGTAGTLLFYRTSAASTNAVNIKASGGNVYSIAATNTNAAVRYLRFYNSASAPTVGTTATVACIAIPGNGGIAMDLSNSWNFTTGIAISLTTGAADTNTSAVAADELKINIGYI
jgi:hypothetical protein